MANKEHLNILKQGPSVWNQWRKQNPEIVPNLSDADLSHAFLSDADLSDANLSGADLRGKDLRGAYLIRAYLRYANLSGADLRYANLSGANLIGADLKRATLIGANLSTASIGWTVFGKNDLSEVTGLESVKHSGPSTIGVDTLSKSGGQIPTAFLRGCGLSDWEIEATKLYHPNLSNDELNYCLYEIHYLRVKQAIQINPLFISYSHNDSPFVDKLELFLNDHGIRFWRDVHDAPAGPLEKIVDQAIRHNPTVLVILSTNSVKSDWVEHEVRLARKLEKELKRDVICPVALDDSWKKCTWPERLREQITEYNILNFSGWKDESSFRPTFNKLIDGLDLFYK